jgi:hypothetical protein
MFALSMDEGRERDNTSRKGGLPRLPGLYRSTIQPLRRGFYRIHVCEGEITGDNIHGADNKLGQFLTQDI